MKTSRGKLVISLGLTLALAACNDKPALTEDVLAQDTTLARSVMMANRDSGTTGDSLTRAIDSGMLSAAPAEVAVATPSQSPPSAPRREATPLITERPARSPTRRVPRARQGNTAVARSTKNTPSAVLASPVASRNSTPRNPAMRASALIPVGSDIHLTSDERVCSSTSKIGDTFTSRVSEDMVGPLGVVIPKGATATGEVFSKQNDSRTNSDADVGIRIQSLTFGGHTYPITSLVTSSDVHRAHRSHASAGKVIAGAGIGAVLGRVAGGSTKSTIIGAVGGAAAGAVVANRTAKSEHCIPDGGRITARLTEPLRVAFSE